MLDGPTVVLSPTEAGTLMLMRWGVHERLKAMLPPPAGVHRMAAPLLLEGLAHFFGRRLSVALCVDGSRNWSELGLCNSLGGGAHTLHYDVEVRDMSVKGMRLLGIPGDFRRLRHITPRGRS